MKVMAFFFYYPLKKQTRNGMHILKCLVRVGQQVGRTAAWGGLLPGESGLDMPSLLPKGRVGGEQTGHAESAGECGLDMPSLLLLFVFSVVNVCLLFPWPFAFRASLFFKLFIKSSIFMTCLPISFLSVIFLQRSQVFVASHLKQELVFLCLNHRKRRESILFMPWKN